jgi:23S rRNA pseudouridine2605 synthase
MSETRIQKILAQAGIASRRKAEELIKSGAVTVNGKVAKLGDKATFGKDHIKLNGKLIHKVEPLAYVLFYKPKGVISMMEDPEGRPTLKTYLAKLPLRLYPVGSLDFNTDGLLLLTNDGDVAEAIQKNPKFPRIFHVKLKGYLTSEMMKRIERGGKVGNQFIKPFSVRIAEELNKKTKIEIVLLGEANADLKLFLESRGFLVDKITRVGFGHLSLKGLEPGDFKTLEKSTLEALVTQPELGVKEIERRAEKKREILPVDLKDDGGFKLAMTLAPKGKKKELSTTAKTSGIRALKDAVKGALSEAKEAATEKEALRRERSSAPRIRTDRSDRSEREPRREGFSRDRNDRGPRSTSGDTTRGARENRFSNSSAPRRRDEDERRPSSTRVAKSPGGAFSGGALERSHERRDARKNAPRPKGFIAGGDREEKKTARPGKRTPEGRTDRREDRFSGPRTPRMTKDGGRKKTRA